MAVNKGSVELFEGTIKLLRLWGWGPNLVEQSGWKTRSNNHKMPLLQSTVMVHHTGGTNTPTSYLIKPGDRPELGILANIHITKDKIVILAAGPASHAGSGTKSNWTKTSQGKASLTSNMIPSKPDDNWSANRYSVGIEVNGAGGASEWSSWTKRAVLAVVTAFQIAGKWGSNPKVLAHKEFTYRKPGDPYMNMGNFRNKVKNATKIGSVPMTSTDKETLPIIIVAGSANTAQDTLHHKYKRRLDEAIKLLQKNSAYKILVTGGIKAGHKKSEAYLAEQYLIAQGINSSRILVENKSGSTSGNFTYGLPIAYNKGYRSVIIVSDFSHMRRCLAFCYAASKKKGLGFAINGTAWYKDSSTQDATVSQATSQTKAVWSGMTNFIVESLDYTHKISNKKPVNVVIPQTIRKGSTGANVKKLQGLLKNLVADGIFGNITEAAVKAYQKSKGLVADGIVGPKTWTELLS